MKHDVYIDPDYVAGIQFLAVYCSCGQYRRHWSNMGRAIHDMFGHFERMGGDMYGTQRNVSGPCVPLADLMRAG